MGKLKKRITKKLTEVNQNFHSTLEELRTVVNDEDTVRIDRMKQLSQKLADHVNTMSTLMEISNCGL